MVKVTLAFGHINPKPGFVSAWDATRNHVGHETFDALTRNEQIKAVQSYVSR